MTRSRWLTLLVSLVAMPFVVSAQEQPVTVTGTVRTPGGEPIPDVQVHVVGTTRGTRTDAQGTYRFTVPGAPGQTITLRATRIGRAFQVATVTLREGTVTRDFTLSERAATLNAVVVTGSPTGTATRREVANVVAQLPAAQIVERISAIPNVTAVLQSRIPGVQVMTQSGTEGTAARVRIRGVSSINASSAPVYVIDGIRMSGGTQSGFDLLGASQSASDAIHPQDVESIEVIKGPAAATLYGADAANGVISITTKRGEPGPQSAVVTMRTSYGSQKWAGKTNTNYALCTQARIDAAASGTLGSYPGCAGLTAGTLLSADLLREDPNALRTGNTSTLHLDATGGGERFGFYVGGNVDDNDGVVHNNTFRRISGRSNVTMVPTDKFTADISLGYYRTDVRLPLSDNASNGLTRNANRGIPGRLNNFAIGWLGLSPTEINQFNDQTRSDRFLVSSTLRYQPFSWFSNRLGGGFDYSSRKNERVFDIDVTGKAPYGAIPATGQVLQFKPIGAIYTVDYAGTISNTLPRRELTSELTFGSQVIASRFESLQANGDGFASNNVRLITLASNRTAFEQKTEQSTVGFLVQEKIGWRDRLFVTAGLRTDDNSAFGRDFTFVAYPKFGASYVISEEPFFKFSGLDELRLRFAWGRAGNAPSPYAAERTFSVIQVVNSDLTTRPSLVSTNLGNPELFAEKGEEYEIGFDSKMYDGRFGAEFTYYDKRTTDALIPVPAAPSSGFTSDILQNVGTISNKGIELSATVIPIDRKNVMWESRAAFATLKNRFVDFGGVRDEPLASGFTISNIGLRVAPGTPLPQFFGTVPSRDENGVLLRNAGGTLIVNRDTVYFGGPLPTRTLSWENIVRLFGNLELSAQLDHQAGHYQLNLTRRTRSFDLITREVVDPSADQAERELILSGAGAQFIERADFVKLREVSVKYDIPERYTSRLGWREMSLSVSGRNLKTWTDYTGADPEVNADAGDFLLAETNAIPPSRRITATLTVRF